MTDKSLRLLLDRAQANYESAWEILVAFKQAEGKPNFLELQPLLCRTMFEISAAYRQFAKRKKSINRRRAKLNHIWVQDQLKRIADRQRMLRHALAIGRVLGDAFVWFFYLQDQKLLELHLSHELSDQLPPGIGGKCEQKFVETLPVFQGAFVLYHGITSLLRIGDFSLFDPVSKRIVGIGELKATSTTDTNLSAMMHVLLPKELGAEFMARGDWNFRGDDAHCPPVLPPKIQERFQRQITQMEKTVVQPTSNVETLHLDTMQGKSPEALQGLFAKSRTAKVACHQFSKGLLLMAVRQGKKRLSSRLSVKGFKPDFKALDIEPHVLAICHPQRDLNYIVLNSLMYSPPGRQNTLAGSLPLFWWPVNMDALRDMVFCETIVMTIFNPAHLIVGLREAGFAVDVTEQNGPPKFAVTYKADDCSLEISNFVYFQRMIESCAATEDEVIAMLLQMTKEILDKVPHKPTKVPIRFNHFV